MRPKKYPYSKKSLAELDFDANLPYVKFGKLVVKAINNVNPKNLEEVLQVAAIMETYSKF
ncbi:hypothetical protein [Streptococcus anginosus]|uniref:hypothetical protein n=1 Tax=Streptococcus anginosus TaxID=1328 RepID=UPI00066D426E|nr:hypothetical protein [Streptococcus anginosus]